MFNQKINPVNSNNNVESENHPIIRNANEYMIVNQIISIHSEDRDKIKYPNSNSFEITLPTDYCNVTTIKLGSYAFPSNYNVFSIQQNNVSMSFKIDRPYNPADNGFYDPLLNIIYQALYSYIDDYYYIFISEGFYTPLQITTELTNRFNDEVTNKILTFMKNNNPEYVTEFINSGGYNQFVIVYNEVTQSIWFGNKSSGFIITNDDNYYNVSNQIVNSVFCNNPTNLFNNLSINEFSNWGLPYYLGFNKCPVTSISNNSLDNYNPGTYPRFYYGDVVSGDNGYWLIPDTSYNTKTVYFLEAPGKINLLGDAYFYMELAGVNSIDETTPFSLNSDKYVSITNSNRGVHNSSFAKLAVASVPISQFYDINNETITVFNPPIERMNKIKVKFRYHDGRPVNFGNFNYSFNLIFEMLVPQILRNYTTYNPSSNSVYGSSALSSKK